jgi:hypothetical protein
MNWIETHHLEIVGVLAVAILLTVGRAKLLPGVKRSKFLLWLAFAVTIICGLVLGWALYGFVAAVVGWHGLPGAVFGSIGAIAAMWMGWHGIYLLIAMIRDVADGTPDDDARKAALWVPTFLPAGWAAAWGVVTNPHGFTTTVVSVILAVITVMYLHRIVKASLAGKNARKAWRWFTVAPCLLAGIVLIPIVAFGIAELPRLGVAAWIVTSVEILLGVTGFALGIAAFIDMLDRVPDAAARAFLAYGLPLLIVSGAVAFAYLSGGAGSGATTLVSVVR